MLIPEEAFMKLLKPGAMYYFIDSRVHDTVPHYFVIINQNIESSPVLVLPVSTTKKDRRKRFYQYSWVNQNCLVEVCPADCNNLLPLDSAFDCNSAIDIASNRFYEKFASKELSYIWMMPEEIVEKLRNGVKESRNIENWIKDLV